METTGQPRDREPRGRQRRVVLRAGSQRQQLEVYEKLERELDEVVMQAAQSEDNHR